MVSLQGLMRSNAGAWRRRAGALTAVAVAASALSTGPLAGSAAAASGFEPLEGAHGASLLSRQNGAADLSDDSSTVDLEALFASFTDRADRMADCAADEILTDADGVALLGEIPEGEMIGVDVRPGRTNCVSFTGDELNALDGLAFTNRPSADAPILIDVDAPGTYQWDVPAVENADPRHVLWNFADTEELKATGGETAQGTVYAPRAKVKLRTDVHGAVVGDKVKTKDARIDPAPFDGHVAPGREPFTVETEETPAAEHATAAEATAAAPRPAQAPEQDACPEPVSLTNGSFEEPHFDDTNYHLLHQSLVPGWSTSASDGMIEVWSNNFQGVVPADGTQFAELNANLESTLFQSVATTPGMQLNWSLYHRGRNGVDIMRVLIGPDQASLVEQVPNGQTDTDIADGNTAWGHHTGTYTVPAGQTTTVFAFRSVSATGGTPSFGNFLDGIQFGTAPCLNVEKTADPASGTAVDPGDAITYDLSATNDGGNPTTRTFITDAIPDGTAFVPGSITRTDPDGNTTSVADADGFDGTQVKVAVGSPFTETDGGSISSGDTWTVNFDVTVDDDAAPGPIVNSGSASYIRDSTGESIEVLSEETTHPVNTPSLDITKSASADQAVAGDTVTYTVTLANTGAVAFPSTTITDDLSGVIDDAVYNDDASDNGAGGTIDYTAPTLTWTGSVPVGATVTITYSVEVNSPPGGDSRLDNTVVGPPFSNCPAGSTDPACSDPVPLGALAIAKSAEASTDPLVPGSTVTYTVTLENTGTAAYTGATITDDLSGVLDDATYNGDVSAGAVVAGETLTWTGDVEAGATVTITYSVTVNDPGAGDLILKNGIAGPPGSTCPPGSTEAPCVTTEPVARLEVEKVAAPDSDPVAPGSKVVYTVTVRNTGQADYPGAVFTDDMSGVLDDAQFNDDASSPDAVLDGETLTWTADVAAGATAVLTYSVTVNDPAEGDNVLKNALAPPDGSSCSPDGGAPPCTTETPIAALTIVKSNDGDPNPPLAPGATVTYTVTVTNTGQAEYPGAVVTDDLSGVVDDARFNDDASDDGAGGVFGYAEPTLTWTGDIPAGATVTLTYSVTVDTPPGGDRILVNTVVGPDGSNCETGCVNRVPSVDLVIMKSADTAAAAAGDTVTYTLKATNRGTADYPGVEVKDDLLGVLDDATYNDDASDDGAGGAFAFADSYLTWTGDVPAGATVTLTYSVTLGDPFPAGDGLMRNTVIGPDGSDCATCGVDVDAHKFDFGDAPDEYQTTTGLNGPHHQITDTLRIGGTITAENEGKPNADATGDEDDAVVFSGAYVGSTELVGSIEVTNTGTSDAILAGWIDLDHDGNHENSEFAQVTVPAGSGTAEYELRWEALVPDVDHFYSRFRLFGELPPAPVRSTEAGSRFAEAEAMFGRIEALEPVRPIGYGGAGEVEDHMGLIDEAPVIPDVTEKPGKPDSGGAGMPVTGASSGVAALGVLLIGLGALALLATRRQRTRVTGI